MARFEVVFETAVYYSVVVDAADADEASEKALDRHFPPAFVVPNGFEVADSESDWFVGGVVRIRDDE